MSPIRTLFDTLTDYHALDYHQDDPLKNTLKNVQAWQRQRLKHYHRTLFDQPDSGRLLSYLADYMYCDERFFPVANQLLLATKHTLSGTGRLEKLIPAHALSVGVLGVRAVIRIIKLDMELAKIILKHDPRHTPLTDETLSLAYRLTSARHAHLTYSQELACACKQAHQTFNSFLLKNAFFLAKNRAYAHGYGMLYDFMNDGLLAICGTQHIGDFARSFVTNECVAMDTLDVQNLPKTPFL